MNLDYATNNGTKFSKIIDPGECMAMTCDWARVSLTYGQSRKDLLNSAKWHIGQSAYEKGVSRTDEKIITAMGLRVLDEAHVKVNSGNSVATMLAALRGTYVWGIVGPGGGHAMGYRNATVSDKVGKSREAIEFFDPNDGLYICADLTDFKTSVANEIDTYYSDLLRDLDVFKVAL
ncbi:MAG: hypothetical protein KDC38_09555 [Planctomycetes bacterium]|nr:hypothetical protein [Planctomycetota bacterium]